MTTTAHAAITHADRSASRIVIQATREPPAGPDYNEQKKPPRRVVFMLYEDIAKRCISLEAVLHTYTNQS
jgi:hypothetical protein